MVTKWFTLVIFRRMTTSSHADVRNSCDNMGLKNMRGPLVTKCVWSKTICYRKIALEIIFQSRILSTVWNLKCSSILWILRLAKLCNCFRVDSFCRKIEMKSTIWWKNALHACVWSLSSRKMGGGVSHVHFRNIATPTFRTDLSLKYNRFVMFSSSELDFKTHFKWFFAIFIQPTS